MSLGASLSQNEQQNSACQQEAEGLPAGMRCQYRRGQALARRSGSSLLLLRLYLRPASALCGRNSGARCRGKPAAGLSCASGSRVSAASAPRPDVIEGGDSILQTFKFAGHPVALPPKLSNYRRQIGHVRFLSYLRSRYMNLYGLLIQRVHHTPGIRIVPPRRALGSQPAT